MPKASILVNTLYPKLISKKDNFIMLLGPINFIIIQLVSPYLILVTHELIPMYIYICIDVYTLFVYMG